MEQRDWHCLEPEDVLAKLESSADGLSTTQAEQRLDELGPNIIPEGKKHSPLSVLLHQFSDFMILVLLAAAVIAGIIGEPQDTIAILVIVVLNAAIGTVQELRAEHALAALKEMSAPTAQVLRDGQMVSLAASNLVPGDIVLLEAGNVVPADLRLLVSEELQADESALTGESQAVEKIIDSLEGSELPLGDRANLVYKSSQITRGRGQGLVVATGLNTEIGRIAELITTEVKVKTPLQLRLTQLGRQLALAVLAICALVFIFGLFQGQPAMLMFLTAVSLAVAAIPEALPAVVTISLALGARKLVEYQALVRNLPAVETLGSVTYICADKTGTLTQNQMTVERIAAGGEQREAGDWQGPELLWQSIGQLLALSNDVIDEDGTAFGEPTELALFQAARAAGFEKPTLEQSMPRIGVVPFDSTRKLMTTLHRVDDGVLAWVKGAPEQVLPLCHETLGPEGIVALDSHGVLAEAQALANEGYRVLALAKRSLASLPEVVDENIEQALTFLGLAALIDPPREEAPQAVADCLSAGITPVMITGDHPGTASAIARRLGIVDEGAEVLTGAELAAMSDTQLTVAVERVRVYARVSPEQKLDIVKALQANSEFVAMTGDGVNDAPALKRASIGVAMGQKGSDVARSAADMVLLDDNFATIVRAVRAGRRIFDNIRKFIKDTMSSNSGEIWTLLLAPLLGLPIPLLPIHILWINLVTDGLPGLAFAAEPAERHIMQRPPRPPQENIFAHGMWQHILWVGLFVAGVSIASQAWAIGRGVAYWQTIIFTVLTISQLFHSLAIRSDTESIFTIGLFSNLPMLGAVVIAASLQLVVIYVPAFNEVFSTQPLPLFDLLICFALSSLVLVVIEIEKWLIRHQLIYQAR
jgi:Ca2+-transporting ATPase